MSETENLKPLKKTALFAILIMPFVWFFEGAVVAAALQAIAQAFPSASNFLVQLSYCIVFITSITFSVIAGVLAKRIDKKTLAVVGLLIYGVMGILPAFAPNIMTIVVERLIMGIGVGLVLPLSNAYIADYFCGKKRASMFGYASSVSMLANIAATFIGGWLLSFGWRYNFYAFVIVLVIMVIALVFLPKGQINKEQLAQEKAMGKAPKEKLPAIVWLLTLLVAFSWAFFLLVILNDATFIVTEKVGTPFMIGASMAFPTAGAAIMGAFYEKIYRKLKNWVPFVSMALQAIGFAVYVNTHSFEILCLANFLTGLGVGLITPFVIDVVVKRVKPSLHERSTGVATAGIHAGQFCSPFIQVLIALVVGTNALRPMYAATAVVFGVAALISLFYLKHKEPQEQSC